MSPVVYRLYDEAGALLYIGCSQDFDKRMKGHMSRSRNVPGDGQIRERYHHHDLTPFDTIEEARAAEAEAIRSETPLFNRSHNPAAPPRRPVHSTAGPMSRALATLVRYELALHGHRAKDLAASIGVSNSTLSRRLNGLNAWPIDNAFAGMAAFLGMSVHEMLTRCERFRDDEQVPA